MDKTATRRGAAATSNRCLYSQVILCFRHRRELSEFDRVITTNLVVSVEHVLLGGSTMPLKIGPVHQVEVDFLNMVLNKAASDYQV